MATKKKHRSKSITVPVAVVAGFAVPGIRFVEKTQSGGIKEGIGGLVKDFTGFGPWSGQWIWQDMRYGLLPVLVGMGVHKIASAMGINRALAQAGVPLLRV